MSAIHVLFLAFFSFTTTNGGEFGFDFVFFLVEFMKMFGFSCTTKKKV